MHLTFCKISSPDVQLNAEVGRVKKYKNKIGSLADVFIIFKV